MEESYEGLTVREVAMGDTAFEPLRSLLDRSFPADELVPYPLLRLMCRRDVGFRAFYDGDAFVGLACLSPTADAVYVLYLAVDDRARSRGYGSKILGWIDSVADGRPVFLEVEPPDPEADNSAQRQGRMRFYGRNGFRDTGYTVHEGRERYDVLVRGPEDSPISGYRRALARMYRHLRRPRMDRRF